MNEELKKEFISRADLNAYTWKNRRRMAWLAFISIVVVTAACLFYVDESRIEKLEIVVTWFYMAMASIVGAYMGFATYASVATSGSTSYPDPSILGAQRDEEDGPPESALVPDVPDDEPKRRKSPMRSLRPGVE